jgi:hypothetical protein
MKLVHPCIYADLKLKSQIKTYQEVLTSHVHLSINLNVIRRLTKTSKLIRDI